MRDSMVIYTAYAEKFKKLSNEQFGLLMRLMIEYQQTGVIPEIDDMAVSLAFDVVRYDIDRNAEKYQETVEKRRESGQKGGKANQANASKEKQKEAKQANATFATSEQANQADNDNDNVNDNDIKKKNTKKKFVPPTVDEVREYAKERGSHVDPDEFYEYFTKGNWFDSKGQKVNNWKQKFLTWEKFNAPKHPPDKNPFMKRDEGYVLRSIEDMAMKNIGG